MLGFSWVVDGITTSEALTISRVLHLVDFDPNLARDILALGWMSDDDMPPMEGYAFGSIALLASSDLSLASRVIKGQFMEPPFRRRDEYVLNDLASMSIQPPGSIAGPELLAQISSQPWFNDGIDDLEAALLHAIAVSSNEFGRVLMAEHYVASVPIDLPLAGDTELVVVRHTPFPADDQTFGILEEGIRAIEAFMGTPFPLDDVILIITEPDIWRVEAAKFVGRSWGGRSKATYIAGHIVVNDSEFGLSRATLYHELAHHYMLLHAPGWLAEGAASFLETYVLAKAYAETLEQRLELLDSLDGCGRESIQQHLQSRGDTWCNYYLGERFLLAMYGALGSDAVSGGLTDLYNQSLFLENLDEDVIYWAFLSNVPAGKEEAFKDVYRRYHGGPVVDAVSADNPDRPALMALHDATHGGRWADNGNWSSAAPLGTWHGVETDLRGRVERVELDDNGLIGNIPSELADLSALTRLELAGNELTGEIPLQLANLPELTLLQLGRNLLSGKIPGELGRLANLEILRLGRNSLSGEIPSSLGRLRRLSELELGHNRLSGEMPSALGGLVNLAVLDLEGNELTGAIPPGLGDLSNLWLLNLRNNQLTGEIPRELAGLSNLDQLFLGGNQFTGCIPAELRKIPVNDLPEMGLPYCAASP